MMQVNATASAPASAAAERAHRALVAFQVPDRASAVRVLSMYEPRRELTSDDLAAVLARFPIGDRNVLAHEGRVLLKLVDELADSPRRLAEHAHETQHAGTVPPRRFQDFGTGGAAPIDQPQGSGARVVTVSAEDLGFDLPAAVLLTATEIAISRDELVATLADSYMSCDELAELDDAEVREAVAGLIIDRGRVAARRALDDMQNRPATDPVGRAFLAQCRQRVDRAFDLPGDPDSDPDRNRRLEQSAGRVHPTGRNDSSHTSEAAR